MNQGSKGGAVLGALHYPSLVFEQKLCLFLEQKKKKTLFDGDEKKNLFGGNPDSTLAIEGKCKCDVS